MLIMAWIAQVPTTFWLNQGWKVVAEMLDGLPPLISTHSHSQNQEHYNHTIQQTPEQVQGC